MEKPLLSICIPTYNRAEYLAKSLDSLIVQPEFSQIEVVISDNASTDNTEEVCKHYREKYPNIVYYRNQENILDRNFPTVLNDTAIYEGDFLSYILEMVKTYFDEKPFLAFLNSQKIPKKKPPVIECNDFSEFCVRAARELTWVGSFGLWEEECDGLDKEFSICELNLWQTYKALKIVSEKKKAVIFTKTTSASLVVQKKDWSYGIYTVFYKNFPSLFLPYLNSGLLSESAFKKIRKNMLFSQAGVLFFRISKNYKENNLGNERNYKELILKEYRHEPYYFHFLVWNFFYTMRRNFFDFLKILYTN